MSDLSPKELIRRYRRAMEKRQPWEPHWRECYAFSFPQREPAGAAGTAGSKRMNSLFDGTAPDAVEQLAASLLSQLTPPWARWFGLAEGSDVTEEDRRLLGDNLDRSSRALQSHFDRSNFAVEMHRCYLDLVVAGTASLLFEEDGLGAPSAFRFTSVPVSQVAFEENANGDLDTTFRRSELTADQLRQRFPKTAGGLVDRRGGKPADDTRMAVGGYAYAAVAEPTGSGVTEPVTLAQGKFRHSPFINFRWLKAPGEVYGRSPVMKALPDIKTVNKVVELVLKNASIAVTGIWQADDNGVLNPANISLKPGTIIPKAVGSAGLTPLDAPGRFDLSQLILDDLRKNIRRALLADRLGQPDAPSMTATEVLERAAEMARLLGATFGRLQSEMLSPLVRRSLAILARRGEIPDFQADGRIIDLEYRSPLARNQAHEDAQNIMRWLQGIRELGADAGSFVDPAAVVHGLRRAFGVPMELVRPPALTGPAGPSMDDALIGVSNGGSHDDG